MGQQTGENAKKLEQQQSQPRLSSDASDEHETHVLRNRAADLLFAQRDKVNRRIHSRMLSQARKITDTEEVLSTALRRIDSLILSGKARAETDAQLFALVHQVIERTILEKARNARRLKKREQVVAELSTSPELKTTIPTPELCIRIGQFAQDPVDREIAMLRARGLKLHEIAASISMSDSVVRKRWSRLKSRARGLLSEGNPDDHRQ